MPERGFCQARIEANPQFDIRPDIVNRIASRGWLLYEIRSMDPTLEDIFVEIIAGEKEEA